MIFDRWLNNMWLATLLGFGATVGVAGDAPLTYDRISLSVNVEEDVEADLLAAALVAQREGRDAAALAGDVNGLVDWALQQAAGESGVEAETTGYTTTPVYSKTTLTGWRVRQGIRLRSKDAPVLSALVGRLQERLLVESIDYEISDERRSGVEERLVKAGIAAFRARARLIAEQMEQPQYRLVEMRVDAQGGRPAPIYRAASQAIAMADAAPIPPRIEAGKQTVRVTVSGVIELQLQ
jgi:predicted secreted protein